jgi:hypothetical protein
MDSWYEPEWSNYLKQFDVSSKHFAHVPSSSEKYCVIVEPRKHVLLKLVCKNFMFLLKGWGLIVFHGSENDNFVKSELADIPNVHYVNMKVTNLTILDYNNLLTGVSFWKTLSNMGCKHSLIFQTDTLLLKSEIDNFLKYDYVGAPWINSNRVYAVGGNGGLSLRNVEKMKTIVENYPRRNKYNEDIYFSQMCLKLEFSLPSKVISSQFSVESMFYESPCGLHKPHMSIFQPRDVYTNLLSKRFVIS